MLHLVTHRRTGEQRSHLHFPPVSLLLSLPPTARTHKHTRTHSCFVPLQLSQCSFLSTGDNNSCALFLFCEVEVAVEKCCTCCIHSLKYSAAPPATSSLFRSLMQWPQLKFEAAATVHDGDKFHLQCKCLPVSIIKSSIDDCDNCGGGGGLSHFFSAPLSLAAATSTTTTTTTTLFVNK